MASYSDVEICNLALIRCGSATIGSLSEDTEQARTLRKIYPMIRDSVLQKADWNFARKEDALALTNQVFNGWPYAYAYPSDCLEFRYIYNASFAQSSVVYQSKSVLNVNPAAYNIPFEVRVSNDGNSKIIVTGQQQAVGIYTRQITNSGVFSPLFVDALAARLAAELACSILINQGVHDKEMQKYFAFITEAQSASASEEGTDAFTSNPIADSRN